MSFFPCPTCGADMNEKTKISFGERIAEKAFLKGLLGHPNFRSDLAALIDLEVQQKNLDNETQPPQGLPNEETGLLPCPFCGNKNLAQIHATCYHVIRCRVCAAEISSPHLDNAHAAWNKRATLIPSGELKSTVSEREPKSGVVAGEKENQSPLIEALRLSKSAIEMLTKNIPTDERSADWVTELDAAEIAIQKIESALAQATPVKKGENL